MNKLLVVDDDTDILTICRYCLDDMKGVEVRYCSSGKDAIKEAIDFEPDLILLDVMMPLMDGVETFKSIKNLPSLSSTSIIFLTAKLQEEEIQNYLDLGAIGVIKKPFDPLTFSEIILEIYKKNQ